MKFTKLSLIALLTLALLGCSDTAQANQEQDPAAFSMDVEVQTGQNIIGTMVSMPIVIINPDIDGVIITDIKINGGKCRLLARYKRLLNKELPEMKDTRFAFNQGCRAKTVTVYTDGPVYDYMLE